MPIHTRRWDDPPGTDEGTKILVTRYRPRGLPKGQETWDRWQPELAPSRSLHAAAYAKGGSLGIGWAEYRVRYLTEMRPQSAAIAGLADVVRGGGTITLLCSSQCDRESRCHRSLLKALIESRATGGENQAAPDAHPESLSDFAGTRFSDGPEGRASRAD